MDRELIHWHSSWINSQYISYINFDLLGNNCMAIYLPEKWDIKYDKRHNAYIIENTEVDLPLAPEFFTAQFWYNQQSILKTAAGRGTTYFVQHQDDVWVLRQYLRGGLVAKVIKQHFYFTTVKNTRVYQEIALLLNLRQAGINVPQPIGGYVQKHVCWYTNRILLQAIPGAQEIHQLCRHAQLTEDICQKIGVEIAKMHNAGVFHHDLNIQNILQDDQGQIWLIDFDKCFTTKHLTHAQCQMNIARLHRSINKKRALHPDYVFTDKHWGALIDAYEDALLIAS